MFIIKKMNTKSRFIFYLLLLTISTFSVNAQQLAFPGADGYGKYVTGGRGGSVYEVTNLKDDGLPGSLRYAINQSGTRTIVFRVSGTIELNSSINITKGDLTIAGQTAPGDGICVKNYKFNISASNVIIRYMRFRLGDSKVWGEDAFGGYSPKNSAKSSNTLPVKNIIIDHCSVSYGSDETLSIYDIENLTVQWCIISESLNKEGHGFGGIMGGWGASLHHTLFAHHKSRSPRFCGARYQFNLKRELVDMRNNVIYNAGHSYGGEGGRHNVVNNYYKRGESDFCNPTQPNPSETDKEFVGCVYDSIKSYWYVDGNYISGNTTQTANNWSGGGVKLNYPQLNLKEQNPFPSAYDGPIETAEEAFINVCLNAGATLPKRDAVDTRVVNDVINNTGKLPLTIADIPGDAFPVLNSLPAPDDSDHDGMPDDWETKNGLNKNNPEDRNAIGTDGYTNLENYLNSLVQVFIYPPTNLNIKLTGITSVELNWTDNSTNETGFRIERAEGETENYIEVAEVQSNVTTFVDSALNELTKYSYRLIAFKDSLTSSSQGVVKVTTLAATSLPIGVTIRTPNQNSSNIASDSMLIWEGTLNADSYDVYFGTTNPPPFVNNQKETTYIPGNMEKGTKYYWRIDSKNSNGISEGANWAFTVEKATGISKFHNNQLKAKIYPNPFDASTKIEYELKSQCKVKLVIYNLMGQEIKTLVNQEQTPGEHSATFDGRNLENGIYMYKLKVGSLEQQGKILLIK